MARRRAVVPAGVASCLRSFGRGLAQTIAFLLLPRVPRPNSAGAGCPLAERGRCGNSGYDARSVKPAFKFSA
jgi:hypothetical protein